MTTLEILPFILFIVVIVTAISEHLNVPYPLLLVIAGLIVGFIPGIPNWHPQSNTVLAIFLPPILFSAARLTAWQDIQDNMITIGSLSILLVLVTTLTIAFALSYFIPDIPFSVALVLGAIISPTDTVAANAILSKMNVQQHIIRTIEVESLFNDAMGIVLYKAALLMVFIGTLKFSNISTGMLIVGVGGIAVGLLFAYFTSIIIEQFLTDSENELPIIMSLILAYVAYLFAERIGVSGVLSVVAAGLYHKKTERKIRARTRLSETTVWDTLIFFLNGIIFITIGIQFPSYLEKVKYIPTSRLILFSVITIVALLVLRLIWVGLTAYIPTLAPSYHKRYVEKSGVAAIYKKVLIVSWSGMRGLVSLALAIAVPNILPNSSAFPSRDLIIFLTIITILFTLLVQGLSLPFLTKKLHAGKDNRKELEMTEAIYQKITRKAIKNMHTMQEALAVSKAAKQLVENYYANRLLHLTIKIETDADAYEIRRQAEALLAKVLQYERTLLAKLRKHNEVSEEIYIKIIRKIDRDEVGFASYR